MLDLCLADSQSQYVINIRLSSGLSLNHKGSGEIWPDGGRCDNRMRTVEVLLRWRGDLTFSWAKTVRFVNSSRRPAHTRREDNYFTAVQSWAWYFHQVQTERERKKLTGMGVAMDSQSNKTEFDSTSASALSSQTLASRTRSSEQTGTERRIPEADLTQTWCAVSWTHRTHWWKCI